MTEVTLQFVSRAARCRYGIHLLKLEKMNPFFTLFFFFSFLIFIIPFTLITSDTSLPD